MLNSASTSSQYPGVVSTQELASLARLQYQLYQDTLRQYKTRFETSFYHELYWFAGIVSISLDSSEAKWLPYWGSNQFILEKAMLQDSPLLLWRVFASWLHYTKRFNQKLCQKAAAPKSMYSGNSCFGYEKMAMDQQT